MPILFYGRLPGDKVRRLHNDQLVPFESSVFDRYKIDDLAPHSRRPGLGLLWWVRINPRHPHTAIAWHDEDGEEDVVFLPGEHDWSTALMLARDVFYDRKIVPPASFFRFVNYEEPYVYL